MRGPPCRLVLEDGSSFEGTAFGHHGTAGGEVVFNTGMVGYPESLTDPSYRGQILVMTYPLVGNYGVPARTLDEFGLPVGFESDRIQVRGLVVGECCARYSHHDAVEGLGAWLARHGVPGLAGVDTRAVTRRLREKGTMLGRLDDLDGRAPAFAPGAADLVSEVAPESRRLIAPSAGAPTVVLVDCGCKASIKRALLSRGLNLRCVPAGDYFLDADYDGLVVSNGPGDPEACAATIRHVEHAMAVGRPILGICLGHQILALAAGARTYKLRFGHRGQNQPCVELAAGGRGSRCVITSQNHGYAVRGDSVPDDWNVWFSNANDGTVEGLRHRTRPFRGVQFHPEAAPGPTDTAHIFDEFARDVAGGMR
jgi:carbamoyl-phosphate synthase small subunit